MEGCQRVNHSTRLPKPPRRPGAPVPCIELASHSLLGFEGTHYTAVYKQYFNICINRPQYYQKLQQESMENILKPVQTALPGYT